MVGTRSLSSGAHSRDPLALPTLPLQRRCSPSPLLEQILFQDCHLELERAIVVLVIDEQHADEFLADIDFGGAILFRTRHDADFWIAEHALEVGVEFSDFLNVHGGLQSSLEVFPGGFRTGRREPPEPFRLRSNSEDERIQRPVALSIWSMVRDGSAQPASPTILAGTPATVTLCGTAFTTTEPAAMRAQWPTSILPRILAPAPIITPWRIFGWRSSFSLPVPPSVTPCRMETSSSITAVSPQTNPVA